MYLKPIIWMKLMKLLKLQMFPCGRFHFLGNPISCLQLPQQHHHHRHGHEPIKLIKSDGLVEIYDKPIHVAELMTEFPKHLVCRSDSFYIGQKIPALAEDDQLQLGQKYFLLPKDCFQTVLSFVTIASLSSTNAFLRKAAACQPFDIQKSPSGCARIRISDEFIAQLMGQGVIKGEGAEDPAAKSSQQASRVCTTPQLEKDYSQLVNLRRWKPKLDAIKEIAEKKRPRAYYYYSFGMKRVPKRKLSSSKNQKPIASSSSSSSSSSDHLIRVVATSAKSSSKTPKIVKIKSRK